MCIISENVYKFYCIFIKYMSLGIHKCLKYKIITGHLQVHGFYLGV